MAGGALLPKRRSRFLSASAVRAIHANQDARQVCVNRDRLVDAICLSGEICVQGANHDSTMGRHLAVKRDEVFPVDGQNGTIPQYGEGKDGLVRDPLIGFPASRAVTTSCPSSRSFTTVSRGKFSFE